MNTRLIYNVTQPTLTAFIPESSISNGTAIIVCPGGAFHLESFARKGLRVLGVGSIDFDGSEFPATQQELKSTFLGLIGFYDPPKKNIAQVFNHLYNAGIKVKIITGDNLVTTTAIAKQADFKGWEKAIDGAELSALGK